MAHLCAMSAARPRAARGGLAGKGMTGNDERYAQEEARQIGRLADDMESCFSQSDPFTRELYWRAILTHCRRLELLLLANILSDDVASCPQRDDR
jgi:hypothetical protein